jgi:hypothetical protein
MLCGQHWPRVCRNENRRGGLLGRHPSVSPPWEFDLSAPNIVWHKFGVDSLEYRRGATLHFGKPYRFVGGRYCPPVSGGRRSRMIAEVRC